MPEGGADLPAKDIDSATSKPATIGDNSRKIIPSEPRVDQPVQVEQLDKQSPKPDSEINLRNLHGVRVAIGEASDVVDKKDEEIEQSSAAETRSKFIYKGVEIDGIQFLEDQGVLKKAEILELLDRLPDAYFKYVPLGKIVFQPFKLFSISRGDQLIVVKESEMLPNDKKFRRVRGIMNWNSELKDGKAEFSDGQMTIQVFSPKDWEDKPDGQTDKDVALYTLSHELGHAFWDFMAHVPDYYAHFRAKGIPLLREVLPFNFIPLIEAWNELDESTLPRYLEYKPIFTKESERIEEGKEKTDLVQLAKEEDFAIAHEAYLFNRDLDSLDPNRFEMIDLAYEMLQQ